MGDWDRFCFWRKKQGSGCFRGFWEKKLRGFYKNGGNGGVGKRKLYVHDQNIRITDGMGKNLTVCFWAFDKNGRQVSSFFATLVDFATFCLYWGHSPKGGREDFLGEVAGKNV